MKIVFRCDASIQIGTGHVMRCLTLAAELSVHSDCLFICRAHDGHLADFIKSKGFQIKLLTVAASKQKNASHLEHAEWLGASYEEDALEVIDIVKELNCEISCLIVDHYAIDKHWHFSLRPYVGKIVVIDDLADREHDCEILLDVNLGRQGNEYTRLIPLRSIAFYGPKYMLIRKEFRGGQEGVGDERQKIIVSFGGTDPNCLTEVVALSLASSYFEDFDIYFVLSDKQESFQRVKKIISNDKNMFLLNYVDNMNELLAGAKVCIGAVGSMALERCALGVPSIIVPVGKNQELFVKHFISVGCAIEMEKEDLKNIKLLQNNIDLVLESYEEMSFSGLGLGVGTRVSEFLEAVLL